KTYIIPKPIDNRLIVAVSSAVAKAAVDSGVARKAITDWGAYEMELENRLGKDNKLMRTITDKAKSDPKRIVFAEADHYKILKAAQVVRDEGIAKPILLGDRQRISAIAHENFMDLSEMQIIDPLTEEEDRRTEFGDLLWKRRQRRGLTQYDARKLMRDRNYFG